MKPLTIELVKGAKRELQSVGWKTPKENDCRRHFFALSPDGKLLVVTPTVALPDFYDPNRQARAVFSCEPFPKAVCVEISPCRLLPPPCYQSREEFESQRDAHALFEPWKWIYLRAHNQFLLLEPSDDGPLLERLEKWLAPMRAAYEQQSKELRAELERLTTKPLSELGCENEEQRTKRISDLQAYLANILESETPIDNAVCKGRLKLTLADVKLGHEGIRDAWMHEDWAAKNGEDLGAMLHERHVFRRWLETHTGTLADIIDATTRPTSSRQGIAPPRFGERFDSDPRFLEACAMVRYRARFADNANTVVYLADCELREELTAEERDEAAKLTVTNNQAQDAAQPAVVSAPLATPDSQFEYVNLQGTEWRKAGPQMVRRRELAEHLRTYTHHSGFRHLLELHRERWFYPVKQIAKVRNAAKGGKDSPAAAMFDITDWDSNWHPPSAPNWKHPGKKSEPFRANQS